MKYAIISDIHGNYHALKNVIEDACRNKVESFIFIGDYIFDLPFSNEVVRCISKIKNAVVVLGNKETYIENLSKENQEDWTFDQLGVIYQTYRELSAENINFISTLKESEYIPLETGGCIYASHYPKDLLPKIKKDLSPSKFYRRMAEVSFTHEQFLKDFETILKQESYNEAFSKIDAKVILMGHFHIQCYGYCGEKLIINPGSCGQPLDFDNRAAYTILEDTSKGFNVTERRVEYDVEAVIRLAEKTKAYECGTIWCKLIFLAMKTGKDCFGTFFDIASQIADSKGEKGSCFTNETWQQAYDVFANRQF